jgi:DNA-directed RNA polymerase specialized sigma24 family protein
MTDILVQTIDRYSELSDDCLLGSICDGDLDAATHLLLVRCGPGLKYLVQGKYRTLGLQLEDMVSELYLLLQKDDWRALRAFRGVNQAGVSCKITHYVICIASRLLWKKMGKAVKETAWLMPLDEMEWDMADKKQVVPRISSADLMEAILALPDKMDRAILILYKMEGKDVAEVAKMLNTTTGNVYTRCSRAIDSLRAFLLEGERI